MSSNNFHISPEGHFWKVSLNGIHQMQFPTQEAAYDYARRTARMMGGGEISIHGRDGRVREKNTIFPANDPRSIRG